MLNVLDSDDFLLGVIITSPYLDKIYILSMTSENNHINERDEREREKVMREKERN